MRVVTLLPAATEIVAALGELRVLVGVSHECDYPPAVQRIPRVTTTPIDLAAPGRTIDAEVRRLREFGRPVIAIDADQLRRLAPDLIITQSLCEVCAVSDGEVHRLASRMEHPPRVVSLVARDLNGIWKDIRTVGAKLQLEDEAEELVRGLQGRLNCIRSSAASHPAKVLCVEWLDPLYLSGHWVPELVDAAGGIAVGTVPGSHSVRHSWSAVAQFNPDLILVMLCGCDIARARTELEALDDSEALGLLRRTPTWIIDGNAYTSRAGPRIVDGAEWIQAALHARNGPGAQRWDSPQYAPHS